MSGLEIFGEDAQQNNNNGDAHQQQQQDQHQQQQQQPRRPVERKEGDWDCPACGNMNFSFRRSCKKCNTERTDVERVTVRAAPRESREGDWICPMCQNHNFAFRTVCKQCNHPATGGEAAPMPGGYGRPPPRDGYAPRPGPNIRPGDWPCPDPACGLNNFASRHSCHKCGIPRPADGYAPPPPPPHHGYGGYPPPPPPPQQRGNIRPGDWPCPDAACRANNFASRQSCHKCGIPRPAGGPGAGYGAAPPPPRREADPAAAAPTTGTAEVRAGDWLCECGKNNFSYRTRCKFCDAPKPGGAINGGGFAHPPPQSFRRNTGSNVHRPY